jgi:hypothetical protein
MPLSVNVGVGYNFSAGEKVTYTKLNRLGAPSITFTGSIDSNQITDGAVLTSKLEQGIDINSKISDHNLSLAKLEAGTQGQLLYYNADGDLVKLPPGSDGQFLRTKGSSAAPEWAAQGGLSTLSYEDLTTDGNDKYLTTDSTGSVVWINKPVTTSVSSYTSSNIDAIRSAGFETISVGFVPEHIRVTMFCQTTDASTGYQQNDEFEIGHNFWSQTGENRNGVNVIFDFSSNSVRLQLESAFASASNFRIMHKTSGASVDCDASILKRFVFKVRAWESGFSSSGNSGGALTSEPGYYFSATSPQASSYYIFGTTASERSVAFDHQLGSVPKLVRAVFVATEEISELGLSAQDEVDVSQFLISFGGGSQWHPLQIKSTSSQVSLVNSLGVPGRLLPEYSYLTNSINGQLTILTDAIASKMKLKIYAWK